MTHPLCRYCGKPIPKYTRAVYYHQRNSPPLPASIEEARRTTNQEITAWRYTGGAGDRQLWCIYVWDGETYVSDFWCSNTCARLFASLMARQGHCTKTYNDAIAAQRQKEPA